MTIWTDFNNWLALHENIRLLLIFVGLIIAIYVVTNWRNLYERLKARLVGQRPQQHLQQPRNEPAPQTTPLQNSGYVPTMVAEKTQSRLKQNMEMILSDIAQVEQSINLIEADVRSKRALWEQLKSQHRTLQGMLDAVKREMNEVDQVLLNGRLSAEVPRPPLPKPGEPSIDALFNEVTKQ